MNLRSRKNAQDDGESREPLLCGGVLCARVDLLPECQTVIYAAVVGEVERYTRNIVEHDVGDLKSAGVSLSGKDARGWTYGQVPEVDDGPGEVLSHSWNDVQEDDPTEDENDVDEPRSCEREEEQRNERQLPASTCGLVSSAPSPAV